MATDPAPGHGRDEPIESVAPASPASPDDVGYGEAMVELEAILADLERDDVDIDVLGPQVRRAAALIRVCRDRIATARLDVEQIMIDLDEPA